MADATIFTREDGTPIPRPERSEYPDTADGAQDYIRDWLAYRDEIARTGLAAFDKHWWRAIRRGVRE